ncbi:MAG: hypothetical protein E5Y81_06115, partial [Mesorhizobium sp.]
MSARAAGIIGTDPLPFARYGKSSFPAVPAEDGGAGGGRTRRWTINGDFVALPPNGVARYAREVT